ncbi:MAG: lantibiotic dehydratase family protein [Bacteroidota bacterium]
MKKTLNTYEYFSSFILRTPLLPFNFYQNLTLGEKIEDSMLKKTFQDPKIQEAIFLASPTLYVELEKWMNGQLQEKRSKKVKLSFLKYLTRLATRCTPFGLFAGCSLGKIAMDTTITMEEYTLHKRHTRLDMNYLVALSQQLAKNRTIKKQLRFYPNSSIYKFGNQLRYIEYHYIESIRHHHIVEVDHSIYLQKVLDRATSGAFLHELAIVLISDAITKDEADSFIEELVSSQLLVSQLEPSVSGDEFTVQLLTVLKGINGCHIEVDFLTQIQQELATIDCRIGNSTSKYLEIGNMVKEQPTEFQLKFLFQTDLKLQTKDCTLSTHIMDDIKNTMVLLNRISFKHDEGNLSKFKAAFQERYEDREMPLAKVLDVETGIGYLQDVGNGDINPLVDDLVLPASENNQVHEKIGWNDVYDVLLQKLTHSYAENTKKVILTDSDFNHLPLDWSDLPDTMSSMIELVHENGTQKIKLTGFSGSSAANLLGRFCHGDDDIHHFTREITALEKQMNPDVVLAEIVHLPEARVGNILAHPSLREYEIPYLAKPSASMECVLPIQDLFISVSNNRLVLRSHKLNKEIRPMLSNAHNFSVNALPIYHFLCDMQTQGLRNWIGFHIGPLAKKQNFLPRVEYKDIILQDAQWNIAKAEIEPLFAIDDGNKLIHETQSFCRKRKLPSLGLLIEGDNELLINFTNITSIQMWLGMVKGRPRFTISEFLFSEDGLVTSKLGYYTNQLIVAFYNQQKLKRQKQKDTKTDHVAA